jgi:hypothetical protein
VDEAGRPSAGGHLSVAGCLHDPDLVVPDVGNAGIIADDVVPGDILETRLTAWRERMPAVAERGDLVRVIRRRRAAAMLPPATAMTWAYASPDGPGFFFSIARSVPGFGLT